jgi:hypothetical protein
MVHRPVEMVQPLIARPATPVVTGRIVTGNGSLLNHGNPPHEDVRHAARVAAENAHMDKLPIPHPHKPIRKRLVK